MVDKDLSDSDQDKIQFPASQALVCVTLHAKQRTFTKARPKESLSARPPSNEIGGAPHSPPQRKIFLRPNNFAGGTEESIFSGNLHPLGVLPSALFQNPLAFTVATWAAMAVSVSTAFENDWSTASHTGSRMVGSTMIVSIVHQ